MNGFLALMEQDFKRLLTNALFWVITATLVIIIAVVNFALPENVTGEEHGAYSYNTDYALGQTTPVDSEEALRRAVEEDGIIGLMGTDEGKLTVLHPGLSEKTVRAIMVLLQGASGTGVEVERIHEGGKPIPFNKRMTPIFVCFEALIIGFVLGGALLLSEKEEGTVRALRIAPLGVDRYLISKAALFSVIAVVYALLMAVFCVGFGFSIVRFVLLSFFGTMVYSLIGLAFTALFKDMSSWFFSMALLLSINMLPVVAFTEPAFSPLWLRAIPSYAMLFEYDRILFGVAGAQTSVALNVAAWCAGAYLLSRLAVGRYFLMKGVR